MLNLRTRKIFRDLWDYKSRTALILLTIAISIFSIGSMGRVWYIMSTNLNDTYLAANPASATLVTAATFDRATQERVARIPAVGDVQAVNILGGRIEVGPNRWRTLQLISVPTDHVAVINQVEPETGVWPPGEGEIVIERTSLPLLPFSLGDPMTVEVGNQKQLVLAGTVHDITQISSSFSLVVYGYVTEDTFTDLVGRDGFSHLEITTATNRYDRVHIEQVVDQVTDLMESDGEIVIRKDVPTPGKHPLDNVVQSVLLLLLILTALGILLGTFLVINIISAQLTQQTQQIGTIKAVGGESRQVIIMYLFAVLLFGLIALAVTVPASIVFSRQSTVLFAGLINFDIERFDVTAWNYVIEFVAGLLLPALAALYPIIRASRMTVRESIGSSGGQDTSSFGAGGIDSLLSRLPNVPSTILYPFRNIFRRKVRLALAAITLSVAGAIWIAVGGVRASLATTVDEVAQYWQEDIGIAFSQTQHYSRIERLITEIAAIEHIEPRLNRHMFRVRPDGTDSIDGIDLLGLAATSPFIEPTLVAGRWLSPDDRNAVVINLDVLDNEPDLAVGDTITLKFGDRETDWHIVGVVTSQVIGGRDLLNSPIGYVDYAELARATNVSGRVDRIAIASNDVPQAEAALESVFAERGIGISVITRRSDLRAALDNSFSIVLTLLRITSLVFGLVGGLGLTSMMTLNVLERTREIGIIRSVGGVRFQLSQIIVTEGIFVGVMSWVLASIIAVPLSIGIGDAVGATLLGTALTHRFPLQQPLIWLGLVVALSVVASLIPGANAARLTVRETISFE